MMRPLFGFLLGSLLLVAAPPLEAQAPGSAQVPGTARDSVSAVLGDFHNAASHADFERYFSHFAREAVFIGTDATERWTVAEFRAYAKRRFDAGDGWTYVPRVRHVYLSADGNTAWFDEILDNDHYGTTRSTGVLVREDGAWRIAQYHLTIPIPNDLADKVVAMIREQAKEGAKGGGR
ncbi:MAG: nuclear transport factor 2 family protein [Candidatus Palauibacterales bacterium]|nr:nuclear transport factor 2 family protein [Candidatus Palauibacterales bacterium]MDP2528442.1 nuclear transport factor 2 family protein [Candidatus Palauibacterales bacterium]MDP2584271.1 nuclear transport factor 2 family protein [Candidatus Palauibacterales bacterium]